MSITISPSVADSKKFSTVVHAIYEGGDEIFVFDGKIPETDAQLRHLVRVAVSQIDGMSIRGISIKDTSKPTRVLSVEADGGCDFYFDFDVYVTQKEVLKI